LGNEIKEREVGVTCMMHGIAQGTQSFQKSRDLFIILSTRMVIKSKFHTEYLQIWCTTVQNSVSQDVCISWGREKGIYNVNPYPANVEYMVSS